MQYVATGEAHCMQRVEFLIKCDGVLMGGAGDGCQVRLRRGDLRIVGCQTAVYAQPNQAATTMHA